MIKKAIRQLLQTLKLDLTKNLTYDRLTSLIIKENLSVNSNAVDVGCHKGEILDLFLKYAPRGRHQAFEPIPTMYQSLKTRFEHTPAVNIFPVALSDETKKVQFNYVKNAPAYSGIKQRQYDISNPVIEEIEVQCKLMDDLIPTDLRIDLIKIDVEGAEFGVLKGARNVLTNNNPIVIFEFGLGASDCYGTKPIDIYGYLAEELEYKIYRLQDFVKNRQALTFSEFEQYYLNGEYYFLAAK